MADEDLSDEDDRTEEPSQRRLDSARDEGQLPLGRDVSSVAGLLAGAAALVALGPRLVASLVHLVAETARTPDAALSSHAGLFLEPAVLTLAIVSVPVAAGSVAQLVQTGGGLWPHLPLPDPERLTQHSPARLFQAETWQDLGLSLVKIGAVLAALYTPASEGMKRVVALTGAPLPAQAAGLSDALFSAGIRVAVALVVVAAGDLALSRWRFFKRLRMTKDEAKREVKEDEGDPMLRGRRKRKHRENRRATVEDLVDGDAAVVEALGLLETLERHRARLDERRIRRHAEARRVHHHDTHHEEREHRQDQAMGHPKHGGIIGILARCDGEVERRNEARVRHLVGATTRHRKRPQTVKA